MKDLEQKCESQPVNIGFKANVFFIIQAVEEKVTLKFNPLLVF